ncbi:hypothetical protein [Hamadaea tsunoensis]|uniref:hypothetical protein n=1 Tax=Hamadaea tsunoensis TaxID=53368 RepID=UPI0012FAD700|nr:hypothetical protein [Hamadaea tsunoensis]
MTFVLGLMIAAVFALLPAEVSVLGTSGSCGLPISTAFKAVDSSQDEFTQGIAKECKDRSVQRLILGGVIAVIVGFTGLGLLAAGEARALRRPQPVYWWDGRVWLSTSLYPPPPGYTGPWR